MENEQVELTDEVKTQLRERQNELVSIIEALVALETNQDWQIIKELVFNKDLASVERQIRNESLKPTIESSEIYRLQGKRDWISRSVDSDRFISSLKNQLEDIKNKLK